jgi:hypothetical protein
MLLAYRKHLHLGKLIPAMGYYKEQIADLEASINAVPCDAVIIATPMDLRKVVRIDRPATTVGRDGDRAQACTPVGGWWGRWSRRRRPLPAPCRCRMRLRTARRPTCVRWWTAWRASAPEKEATSGQKPRRLQAGSCTFIDPNGLQEATSNNLVVLGGVNRGKPLQWMQHVPTRILYQSTLQTPPSFFTPCAYDETFLLRLLLHKQGAAQCQHWCVFCHVVSTCKG